jgi:hypothetical protein
MSMPRTLPRAGYNGPDTQKPSAEASHPDGERCLCRYFRMLLARCRSRLPLIAQERSADDGGCWASYLRPVRDR